MCENKLFLELVLLVLLGLLVMVASVDEIEFCLLDVLIETVLEGLLDEDVVEDVDDEVEDTGEVWS